MVSVGTVTAGYPDAVSLDPAATVDDVLSLVDNGPGRAVKDGFAPLDLRPVRILAAIDNDVLLAVAVLNRTGLNRAGPVVGVSNVFTTGTGQAGLAPAAIWSDVVAMAARLVPGTPLVGDEAAQGQPPAFEA